MAEQFRCIIHGSFSKHFAEIQKTSEIFTKAGISVLAPKAGELVSQSSGFALFEDEVGQDPRLVELIYLHNLKKLGQNGFSYFVDPEGYIGKSASYELGIAQLTNTRCYFSHKLTDHPAYIRSRSVWSADKLADYIVSNQALPQPSIKRNEKYIHKLWEELMVPGSVVATGAIIEHQPKRSRQAKEILLVKTHKWGNRFSVVGGKVRRNELLHQTLLREVKEETGLKGAVGAHICTFDQLKNSGYYQTGIQHIFVDNIVKVFSKKVKLNEEAQDYIWALPSEALKHLDIEPNARTTLELYAKLQKAI
ncbi:MAG TPA: NUDIX domain-containing protein [Candidatus Saccharimonadales bacterium]|nr:NUDIX domain-containing protein [Candidatus Saccharimonadales bacterium]